MLRASSLARPLRPPRMRAIFMRTGSCTHRAIHFTTDSNEHQEAPLAKKRYGGKVNAPTQRPFATWVRDMTDRLRALVKNRKHSRADAMRLVAQIVATTGGQSSGMIGRSSESRAMDVADLSITMSALRQLRVKDQAMWGPLCDYGETIAPEMSPKNISLALSSMSDVQNYDESFVSSLCAVALCKADSFNAMDICFTLDALASFEHRDEELIARLFEEATKKVTTFGPRAIPILLNTINKLDTRTTTSEELITRLCEQATKEAHTFNTFSIASTLTAMARLRLQHDDQHIELTMRLCEQALQQVESLTKPEFQITLDALSKLDTVRGFHMHVSAMLHSMKIPHSNRQLVEGLSCDIVIDAKVTGLKGCVIELETSEQKFKGLEMTALERCVALAERGVKVVSVPHWQWSKLHTYKARVKFINRKLQGLGTTYWRK